MTAGSDSVDVEAARRDNNFDALRIAAAFFVIVGHCFILLNRATESVVFAGLPIAHIGVAIFFVISGYLITGSWARSRSIGQYVSSRALRIAPLLFLVVLTCTFILGPILTVLPLGEYLTSGETAKYLLNLVLLPADGLPGVFTTVPFAGVVNGSVWTLRAEVICYVVVLVLGLLPRMLQLAGFVAFSAASIVLVLLGPVTVAGASVSAAAAVWIFFAIGALVRLLVPRGFFRPWAAAIVFVAWIVAAMLLPAFVEAIAWLALPYIVLSIGFASTPVLRRAARFGDLSYGLYLWAFPVQQTVITLFGLMDILPNLLIVTATTAVLAFASWHLLEKRALAARFRLPWFRAVRSAP